MKISENTEHKTSSNAVAHNLTENSFSRFPVVDTIQRNLTIGQPGDKYEQEADHIANQVMSMPENRVIQPKCDGCEEEEALQMKPLINSITPWIQTQSDLEEEEPIQTKSNEAFSTNDQNWIQTSLNSSKGIGCPLPNNTRSFMESRFGTDFNDVRIHTNDDAVQFNNELNAQAFTHGKNIYFNSGKYHPGSSSGKHLIAHELTHVIQQTGSSRSAVQPLKVNKTIEPGIIQRQLNYLLHVTGQQAAPFLTAFDNTVTQVEQSLVGVRGTIARDVRAAMTRARALRAAGKVTCWQISGGLYYASYDNASGEIRLHTNFGLGRATSRQTVVHESIHALHGRRNQALSRMYGQVLAAGGTTNISLGILLVQFKAWTEYWAYRRTQEHYNIIHPQNATDGHQSALAEGGVSRAIAAATRESGRAFTPWTWNPPRRLPGRRRRRRRP